MFNDDDVMFCSAARRGGLGGAILLAAALCLAGPPAAAQDDASQAGEDAEPAADAESAEAEDATAAEDEQAEEERDQETPAARRELLQRDSKEQRGTRFPEGLTPAPGIERSDLRAFDARQRGRFAAPPRETGPDWIIDATLATRLRYDSNPLLESAEETGGADTEAWGYEVEPKLTVTRRSARTMFQSMVRLSYDALEPFEDDAFENQGSFDQYGGAQLDVRGQRTSFTVFGNIANTTTRSALAEETGAALSDDRILTYGGGGSLAHAISPTSALQFSAAARRQESDSAALSNSTYYQAAADYRSRVSRTDTIGLGGMYERFMPQRPGSPDVDVATAVVSWSHQASASLSMEAEGGAQFIMTGSNGAPGGGETTIDGFARASLYWAVSARDGISLRASRAAEPNATGEVRTNNRFELAYQRRLSRTVSLGVPVTAIFQKGALGDGAGNRSFLQVAPNLVWAVSRAWGVAAQYRYRLENEDGLSVATSHTVLLSLSYFGRWIP